MNKTFIKKIFLTSAMINIVFLSQITAQDLNQESDEIQENNADSIIKPELQKNLTIIVGHHNYDLNPHTASYNTESQILTGLYEGLFSYDPITLEPHYALATSYRISRDNKRWTFKIRDDAKFSDGTPITAECIKKSWITLLNNKNAPYASLFDIIEGVEDYRNNKGSEKDIGIFTTDDNSITLHLNTPASHLPKLLCMTPFSAINELQNVYSGPFTLSSKTDEKIILKKNTNYYDSKNTYLEQITFCFSDDNKENAYLFNTGLADWISGPIDLSKTINQDSTHITAEFATEYLFFKIRDNIWKEASFRQALLESVPWDQLRANTFVPATTLVYPINGYPKVQGYVYTDKFEAISLMEQAKKDANIPEDTIFEITMAITENEHMLKEANILKEAWKELGVELKTIEIPSDKYLYEINKTDADIFSYTWIGDFADPLAFLELFRGNSTLNVTNWNNEVFNNLLKEAALNTNEKHNLLLSQAEQLLLDEGIILPIQHPVSLNIIDLKIIGGWAPNSFDIHPLKYLFKKDTKPDVPNLVMR